MSVQKGSSPITIILVVITLLSLALSSYLLLTKNQSVSPNTTTPSITPAITQPATDLTANWQTYNNSDLSFKYPASWVRSDNLTITSINPKIRLVIVPKNGTLMNECMKETSTEIKKDYTLRKFQRVTTGAMCATQDPTPKEAWIMPSLSTYSPGVLYYYSSTETTEAESLLDQILATFKFVNTGQTTQTLKWTTYDITPDTSLDLHSYKVSLPENWKQIEHSSNFQDLERFWDKYDSPTYQLNIQEQKNLNSQSGKPYASLKEFVGLPYDTPKLNIDTQDALQPLPRTGSENIFKVFFFSKDHTSIFSIELITPENGSKIEDGKTLFTQIITTFKFLN
jgi:hypothetical protein